MKRTGGCFALLSVFAAILFVSPAFGGAISAPTPFVTIRILHTNDIHGHVLPEPDLKAETKPAPMFGGAAALATAIKQFRTEPVFGRPADVVFYFDAGDFFQGTPEGTLTRGKSIIELFRILGLDAQAAGNHDFDFGPDALRDLIGMAAWPVLSANTRSVDRRFPLQRHMWLHPRSAQLRVAVFGLITDDMASVTTAQARRGFTFDPSIETSRREVAELRDSADLVIALTHVGALQDKKIADTVAGIDVIVGGHSHTSLSPYYRSDTTGTVVVQAGSYLRDLGVLDILYNRQTRKIVPPDPATRDWSERLGKQIGALLDEKVAAADSDYFRASDTECVPGNLLADAMRWATKTEAAFQNSYGVRADLPAGNITLRTLFTMMPFDNTIVSMTLSGQQIFDLLEQSAALDRGFLQMSGLHVEVDLSRPRGERVLNAGIAGNPIDLKRSYRVATNSFLAEGGDLFDTFARGTNRADNGQNLRDVVRDYLKAVTRPSGGVFSGRIEGRIVQRRLSAATLPAH